MTTKAPFEFEKSLAELEAITQWFESSDADLDQGIAKFERGMELTQDLRSHLVDIENRVQKIRQKFDQPKPSPVDSEHEVDQAGLFTA